MRVLGSADLRTADLPRVRSPVVRISGLGRRAGERGPGSPLFRRPDLRVVRTSARRTSATEQFRSPLLREPLPGCRLVPAGCRLPRGRVRATEPGGRPPGSRGVEFRSVELREVEFRSPLLREPLPGCRLVPAGLRSPGGCLRATEPGLRTAATRPLDSRGAEFRSERRGGERGSGAPETGPEGRSSAFGGRSSPGGGRRGGPEGRRGGGRRSARRGGGERMPAGAEGRRADFRRGVKSESQAGVRGHRTPGCRGVESVPRGPRRPAVPCGSPECGGPARGGGVETGPPERGSQVAGTRLPGSPECGPPALSRGGNREASGGQRQAGGRQAEACGLASSGSQVAGTPLPGSPLSGSPPRPEIRGVEFRTLASRSPPLRKPLPACRLPPAG